VSSMSQPDPLVSLWQTGPQPDTQSLMQDLERLNRLHQRLNRIVLAIFCGTALLLVFEEASGRLASHGFLSVGWIAAIIAGAVWKRRARCNRLDALTLDTVTLLKTMIARSKKDLFVARCLYAGVPLGAAVGYTVSRLAGIGASAPARAAHPHLETALVGARVVALVAMMVAGVILARARSAQVRDLNEKLRAMESDL
jgi:hypothetical protein